MPMNASKQHYRNASPRLQQKMMEQDAAIQTDPAFIKLHDHWKDLLVLERAVHVGRLATNFNNTVIARNLRVNEGTVRKYNDIDKLSSAWKFEIARGENYASVLKAAALDPRPEAPTVPEVLSSESASEPANSVERLKAEHGPALGGLSSPITANVSQSAKPFGSGEAYVRGGPPSLRQRRPENSRSITAWQLDYERQLREARKNFCHPQSNARLKYENAPERPKTGAQLQREHRIRCLEDHIKFCHPDSGARARFERELAELLNTEPCNSESARELAETGDNANSFFAARRRMVPSRTIKF